MGLGTQTSLDVFGQGSPFPRANGSLYGTDAQSASAAGWENTFGDTWTNSSKPGQYLSSSSMKSLLAKQAQANKLMNPASFNTGVDYAATLNPFLAKSQEALQGGASSVSSTNEYENRLRQLLDNPDSIADTGAYKFAYNQGQQALERSAAAKGMSGSGNVLAELMRYGQGMASQQYNTEADRMANLSGNQKNYILGLKNAANSESANKSSAYLNMGNLSLTAGKAKSDDYWNANKLASDNAFKTGYIAPGIW